MWSTSITSFCPVKGGISSSPAPTETLSRAELSRAGPNRAHISGSSSQGHEYSGLNSDTVQQGPAMKITIVINP